MSLNSDLTAIKNIQDGVKNNKVTRFAYTQTAYTNNDVNGHDDYVATRDNNIPLSDLSVIEVNQTVVDKGFRARASALNRMFLNHLFGRVSYNLNKINDLFNELLVKLMANLGVADGLATLDSTGRIPYSQLPEDAMEYQGDWDASTNTPTLVDGTGTKGDTYNVSVAGDQTFGGVSVHFFVGDRVIYNGSIWQRASSGNVQTVCEIAPNQTTGNVDLTQQRDITKIFNDTVLDQLGFSIGKVWIDDVFYETTPWLRVNNIYKYNNKYWICGSSGASVSGLMYSNDGYHWTSIPEFTIGTYQLLYAKGVYVVRKAQGGIWWSEDGLNWTSAITEIVGRETRIYFVGDLFIVFADNSKVYKSSDGKNWEEITSLTASSTWNVSSCAYYANGVYLLGGSKAWARSTDGITWTKYTLSNTNVLDYIYINEVFYRITGTGSGTNGSLAIQKSTNDGQTWLNTGVSGKTFGYMFKMCNNKLYTIGNFDGIIGYGGTNYVFALLDYENNMAVTRMTFDTSTAVIYDENTGLYFAGAGGIENTSSNGKGGIYWSKDGVNWILCTKPDLRYTACMSLFADNNILLAGFYSSKGLWCSSADAVHKYLTEVSE